MVKIYGSERSSPANKVRYVANYLGIKYEYISVNLREKEQKKESYLKMNPVGKVPTMDDDGFYLFESGAICKYLASKNNSSLYPSELKARAVVDQWIDFAALHISINMGKVLFNRVFYKLLGSEKDERSLADGLNFLGQYLPILEAQLGKNKYLTGNMITLADLTLLSALDPAEVSEFDLSGYKNIVKWRDALKKESFYKKCFNDYSDTFKQPAGK